MTLVPFNKNEIDDIEVAREKKADVIETIISFIESEHDCVEIINYPYDGAATCRSVFATTIARCGLINITVCQRGNRVFLIKEQ